MDRFRRCFKSGQNVVMGLFGGDEGQAGSD